MKYLRPETFGCKDIEIRKIEFVAKIQFLNSLKYQRSTMSGCKARIGVTQQPQSRVKSGEKSVKLKPEPG